MQKRVAFLCFCSPNSESYWHSFFLSTRTGSCALWTLGIGRYKVPLSDVHGFGKVAARVLLPNVCGGVRFGAWVLVPQAILVLSGIYAMA